MKKYYELNDKTIELCCCLEYYDLYRKIPNKKEEQSEKFKVLVRNLTNKAKKLKIYKKSTND